MTRSHTESYRAGSWGVGVFLAAILALGFVAAPSASATYGQAGTFAGILEAPAEPGVFPEEVQLAGVGGMAVNYTGAGGVPAGTIYAVTHHGGSSSIPAGVRVARYNPDRSFSEAWEVKTLKQEKAQAQYERCGPDGEPAHPHCAARPEDGLYRADVDVDQTTGNVYVFNLEEPSVGVGDPAIVVYSPDGSEVITRFGQKAADSEITQESPEKIHRSTYGAIAVNAAGEVFVFNRDDANNNFYHRLMVFKPQSPGDYEHYVYAGQSHDIGAGFSTETNYPGSPVADAAGNVYVAVEDHVEEYDPAQPVAPICSFFFKKSGITALTVNAETGAPFFYTYKDKKVHQLTPCNGKGEFLEAGPPIDVAPERDYLYGLAVDPKGQLSPGREPGILYGATPDPVPGIGIGQKGRGSLGYVFAEPEESPPVVESESVAKVTTSSAELHAQIDPKGFETRYTFQYITEAAYQEGGESFAGAAEEPPGGAVLGTAKGAISAAAAVTGLQPDTQYRYRAVAESECAPGEAGKVCEVPGTTQSFRTFPIEAPGLPDQRAYELVSPPQKSAGQVLPADPNTSSCTLKEIECKPGVTYQHFPIQSSPDGEAIVYEGTPFDPEQGALLENEYLARRTGLGWTNTNLTPPLLESRGGYGYKAFDPSLEHGLLEQITTPLSPEAPLGYANLYRQATADPFSLRPLLVETPPNRASEGSIDRLKLAYAGSSTDFSRFFFEANDALIPEALDGGESKNNLYEWAGGQLRLVNFAPGDGETVLGAFFGSGKLLKSGGSNPVPDLSHAISSDGSHAFWSSEAGQVYVRIGGTETRKIEAAGKFLTASADGSRVLLDDGCLYLLVSEECEDLTQGKGGFEGIAGQSEDLSHVYFVDSEVLDEAPNDQGDIAQPGKDNLYAWVEGTVSFVATLPPGDNDGTIIGNWQASPSVRTAEASPNGRFVTFFTRAPLTGYANTGPCESNHKGGVTEGLCSEVFLYDSTTDELHCPSCNPSGAAPLGSSVLRRTPRIPAPLPSQPYYLTDSGRLYFDSQDSLSLADTNEGVEDVYQYEPDGVGSCKREDGCVSLLSAGRELADSNLLAVDKTGKSVFFTTRDRLVLKDKDELIDLYVAREGGGIPAETETTRSECQGEACQPAPFVPNDPTPASSSFQGEGNVKRGARKPRCPKSRRQVRRKGKLRCVKRHRHRARAANRNRGGAK